MKADSTVNIRRLCSSGMKKVVSLDRSPQARMSLLVTVHSNEFVTIKAIFGMKCDENTER